MLLVIFAIFIGVLRGSVPRIPAKAALLVAPEGQLVEQLSGEPVERALEEARGEGHAQTLLWELTDSIRAAASDSRIQARGARPGEVRHRDPADAGGARRARCASSAPAARR